MKKKMSDIPGLIVQVQQQLTYLDKKIDALIEQLSARPHMAPQRPQPAAHSQRFDQPGSQQELILHKTVCADCRKECNVPFKPSGDRPVYCKECYARRKASSSVTTKTDSRPYAKKIFTKKWKKRS